VAELIKFEFVINLKRPRALGLALNLLITAAEVIDNDTFALRVRYWPKADILIAWANVRFRG